VHVPRWMMVYVCAGGGGSPRKLSAAPDSPPFTTQRALKAREAAVLAGERELSQREAELADAAASNELHGRQLRAEAAGAQQRLRKWEEQLREQAQELDRKREREVEAPRQTEQAKQMGAAKLEEVSAQLAATEKEKAVLERSVMAQAEALTQAQHALMQSNARLAEQVEAQAQTQAQPQPNDIKDDGVEAGGSSLHVSSVAGSSPGPLAELLRRGQPSSDFEAAQGWNGGDDTGHATDTILMRETAAREAAAARAQMAAAEEEAERIDAELHRLAERERCGMDD
jgi:hypothetical protein